jgi:hypothetical protein
MRFQMKTIAEGGNLYLAWYDFNDEWQEFVLKQRELIEPRTQARLHEAAAILYDAFKKRHNVSGGKISIERPEIATAISEMPEFR